MRNSKAKTDPLEKAKNYVFLLLKFRPRSEKEVISRLKRKKFEEGVIKETIAYLKKHGFIDDNFFVRCWLESRLKRPYGFVRLRQELIAKGIAKEIIDSQIQEIKKNYSEEEIVFSLAKARLNKLKGIEPQKARQRIFGYLLHRGFTVQVIREVIEQLKIC